MFTEIYYQAMNFNQHNIYLAYMYYIKHKNFKDCFYDNLKLYISMSVDIAIVSFYSKFKKVKLVINLRTST